MKHVLSVLLVCLICISSYGQAFEGIVLYSNTYKSKVPNMTDQQWASMMGTTQEYFIKGGDYKSVMNGQMMQWQLFRNKDSKMYTKMSNQESALWTDATVNADEVLKTEVKKSATEILGYKCDEVTLTCKSGVQKYYFNSKFGVDSKLFANHKYGNWYDFLKISNAIPLKIVVDSPQLYMESVATEVTPMKLTSSVFDLPTGLKTEKSPY
jgi:hypothetical protein